MEKVYAFTDECGAFGWDLDNPNVATHFIITSVIVEESELDSVRSKAEEIRKKFFQKSEIKSSTIKRKSQDRRKAILSELLKLDINIFPVVIDKRKLTESVGLKYKETFYKFTNNFVHQELRRAFSNLTVVADEYGSNDYMESFSKYFEAHSEPRNLLGESEMIFENSKGEVLVQVADFFSGTLSFVFDEHKITDDIPPYLDMIRPKMSYVRLYPKTYETFLYNYHNTAMTADYDEDVAVFCFKQAALFLDKHKNDDDYDIRIQCSVLEYLLFRFMNNSSRKYISTKELQNQLVKIGNKKMSSDTFRLKVIGKLRDSQVIIASSAKGYKIPSSESELYDFANHASQVVIPMLNRLKICRDSIKLATDGKLDILEKDEYKDLRKFIDMKDGYDDSQNC